DEGGTMRSPLNVASRNSLRLDMHELNVPLLTENDIDSQDSCATKQDIYNNPILLCGPVHTTCPGPDSEPPVAPAAVIPSPPPPPVLIPSDSDNSTFPDSTAPPRPDPTDDSGAGLPPTNPTPSQASTSRRRTFFLPYTVA
ncbi:hypothetical protein ACHWQZ_G010097, partial [Mnemiopsis leidyi]